MCRRLTPFIVKFILKRGFVCDRQYFGSVPYSERTQGILIRIRKSGLWLCFKYFNNYFPLRMVWYAWGGKVDFPSSEPLPLIYEINKVRKKYLHLLHFDSDPSPYKRFRSGSEWIVKIQLGEAKLDTGQHQECGSATKAAKSLKVTRCNQCCGFRLFLSVLWSRKYFFHHRLQPRSRKSELRLQLQLRPLPLKIF